MPQLFVAAALCGIEIPAVSIGSASVLVVANLLVIGQYIFQFERNGPTGNFTDAIWSLASSLQAHRKDTIFITDWGMVDNVDFLYWGSLDIRPEAGPLRNDTPTAAELQEIGTILEAPNGVFVGHVESREMFPGVGRRLSSFAAAHGYRRVPLATIPDSKGHPVFELFKFECASCRR